MVGAVIALGATTLGEGYHRRRGQPHAEVEALADAAERGNDVRGATLYVSLEPCDHVGLTPPCSRALGAAGVARVVVGVMDPNPRTAGAGVERLRAFGVVVDIAADPWSSELIEDFARSVHGLRPYVRLKLAASLDGCVAPVSGIRHWLTGPQSGEYVRELRASHDAVLVGAGTLCVDDPLLSVRPPRSRGRPFFRAVACGRRVPSADRAIFLPLEGYAPPILLVPATARAGFAALENVADVIPVDGPNAQTFDLSAALQALLGRGIASILCEGGPTLATNLLAAGLVDRLDWIVSPTLLGAPEAVRAIGAAPGDTPLIFQRVEPLGLDILLSASVGNRKETNV